MSFLKIGDRAAGAIKSGGTTRRAAKMVIVDIDHPDIEQFINWKVNEEQKVAALVTGSKINQKHLKAIMKACVNCEGSGDDCFDARQEPGAEARDQARRARASCPDNYIQRVIQFAKQGYTDIDFPIYDTDWDSRGVPHRLRPELQQLGARHRRVPARPSRTTATGTSPGAPSPARSPRRSRRATCGRRSATPPGPAPTRACSTTPPSTTGTPARPRARSARSTRAREYMFLDDTACNLASLNLLTFRDAKTGTFDVEGYEHAVRLWTIVLEISVLMAQFPSQADRPALLRLPHARPRLRQHRRAADASGIPYD